MERGQLRGKNGEREEVHEKEKHEFSHAAHETAAKLTSLH